MRRFGVRQRLFLAVLVAVGVAVAALVLGFNLILARTLDRDAHDLARGRAIGQLALLATKKGHVSVRESPGDAAADAYIWVFAHGSTLERPRAGAGVDAVARFLAQSGGRFAEAPRAHLLLASAPALTAGRRVGTVVAGVLLSPYEQTRRLALISSVVFGALILALVALAARWLLGSALRPVRRMTRQAAAWSEHDLDQRFALGEPHDELSELAATLDDLLDRLAASLRREQRFSAELSHELRTPLARVMAESELALRRRRTSAEYRRSLELINRNALALTRTVDALLAAARHESGSERGTADAFAVATQAAAGCSELARERRLELRVAQPTLPLRVGVEPELVERILQPVLDNACRYGAGTISVTIERSSGVVRYTVADQGPGVAASELERIFEPGIRGERGTRDPGGAGLGLALARRLARSVSGDIEALDRQEGGWFVVTLPKG